MTKEEIKEAQRKVGSMVSNRRAADGLSVAEFAKKIGLTPGTVYRLEAADCKFQIKTGHRLITGLNLTGEDAAVVLSVATAINKHSKRSKGTAEPSAATE